MSNPAQHTDIAPSILDILNIKDYQLNLLGSSLIRKNKNYAVNHTSNSWWIFSQNFFISLDHNMQISISNKSELEIKRNKNSIDTQIDFLKATRQYFTNSLLKGVVKYPINTDES